eukprot:COSAG03_NODE_277_length_9517_cov_112.780739_2_plen_53_part_00
MQFLPYKSHISINAEQAPALHTADPPAAADVCALVLDSSEVPAPYNVYGLCT